MITTIALVALVVALGNPLFLLAALAAAGAIVYYVMQPTPSPRPGPRVEPTGPGGEPPKPTFTPIDPTAERVDYAGHSYYVWEMPNAGAPDVLGWHWVVQFEDVSLAEGHVSTPGLDGAAEAGKEARDWIDTKFALDDSGGAGGAGSP